MSVPEDQIIDAFHELYYYGREGDRPIYQQTYWMKVPCWKCPLDMWIYQEILAEVQPDLLIETGTKFGGSALFFAHMMDILGKGEIITLDIKPFPHPSHPRIRFVTGSSADPQLIHELLKDRPPGEVRLVMLDSKHSKRHVAQELQLLAPYVTVGSYLIVEDTNINGHPVMRQYGPGPFEAVAEFLQANSDFAIERSREKFLLTFSPSGFLKRVR